MNYETVIYEKKDRYAVITLNRPDKLNAINDAMMRDIGAALAEAERDWDVWVVLIKGAGRAFSVGQDLSGVGTSEVMPPDPRARAYMGEYYEGEERRIKWWEGIYHNHKPTVAQIHGYCLAWGLYLAMCCETSIAAEDAVLGDPSVRMGLSSPMPLWTWKVGPRKAKELLFTGKYIDGKEAARLGLITMAVPADRLDEEGALAAETLSVRGGIVGDDGRRLSRAGWGQVSEDAVGMSLAWKFAGHLHALSAIRRRGYAPAEFHFHETRDEKGLKAALRERDAPFKDFFPYGLKD